MEHKAKIIKESSTTKQSNSSNISLRKIKQYIEDNFYLSKSKVANEVEKSFKTYINIKRKNK